MKVNELRSLLEDMPGEMSVYLVGGAGVRSAAHIFALNLIGAEQFCELATYTQEHTEDLLDAKIERETGFKNRDELIEAYKAVSERISELKENAGE